MEINNIDDNQKIDKIDEIRKRISDHKKLLRIKKKKEDLENKIKVEDDKLIDDAEIQKILREKYRINRLIREKRLVEEEKLINDENLNNKVIIQKVDIDGNIIIDKRRKEIKKTSEQTLNSLKNYHKKPYVNERTGKTVKNIYHSRKLDKFLEYLDMLSEKGILIDNKIDISYKDELIKIVSLM